ncbi:MAG: hypothetical protein WA669_19625 [Pseudolabrys sp.]
MAADSDRLFSVFLACATERSTWPIKPKATIAAPTTVGRQDWMNPAGALFGLPRELRMYRDMTQI